MKTNQDIVKIKVVHSPDADDRFMFWPIKKGLISLPGYEFSFAEADTQALNSICLTEKPEICAISAVHYAKVASFYQPLRMGCSVGEGYGPILVAAPAIVQNILKEPSFLRECVLLTPGLATTAHNVVAALGMRFRDVEVVPISPMERVFSRLKHCGEEGVLAIALLIHEGRLIYKNYGVEQLLDVGVAWLKKTGGPLPLGMNVISRSLPLDVRERLGAFLRESCSFALQNRAAYIKEASNVSSDLYSPLSASELENYLDLYANNVTLDVSESVKKAFEVLLSAVAHNTEESGRTKVTLDWI